MVYSVRKIASPMIAIVGGIVWVARALRTNARTMTIRVNEVIMASRLGRRARAVKRMTRRTGVDQSRPAGASPVAFSTTFSRSVMLGRVPITVSGRRQRVPWGRQCRPADCPPGPRPGRGRTRSPGTRWRPPSVPSTAPCPDQRTAASRALSTAESAIAGSPAPPYCRSETAVAPPPRCAGPSWVRGPSSR